MFLIVYSCNRHNIDVRRKYVIKTQFLIDTLVLKPDSTYTRTIRKNERDQILVFQNNGDWKYSPSNNTLVLNDFLLKTEEKYLYDLEGEATHFENKLIDTYVEVSTNIFGCINIDIDKYNSYSNCD